MTLPLSYNWRNLFVRKLSTTLTIVVVAVLVLVLCVLLSFAAGIHASLAASGSDTNVIVLKPGATAESVSLIQPEEAGRLLQTPGVAGDSSGQSLISYEICVQATFQRRSDEGSTANVGIRGIDDMAFQVHPEVRIINGRKPITGQLEVLVGQAASNRYRGLALEDEIEMGRLSNRRFHVVGIFEANGSALESEIWGPRSIISDVFGAHFISSVTLRLADPALANQAIEYINGPSVQLEGKRESGYYDELSKKTKEIVFLTTVLISIMAIGSIFAVANTMFASVDNRRREIAMLRTIGFQRSPIIIAFLTESLLICLVACAIGITASYFVSGSNQDYLSDQTWTVLAYELKITPTIITAAIGLAVTVALCGSLVPALRASHRGIIESLRKA